jgi:AAHS family benzoate transporter-like MFS transporter
VKKIDIKEVIDKSKMGRFHYILLISFMILTFFDGYDMFYLGNIIPSLIEEWNITQVQAGMLTSYGLLGMVIGALSLSILADKIGRKVSILISMISFAGFTLLASFSNDPTSFGILRFIAGLGLGGILPILNASLAEYAPKKNRVALVALMNIGAPIGGVLTSASAMYLLPNFGWRPVLWLGALPLLLTPLLFKIIPDSPAFYYKRNKKTELANVLNKIAGKKIYHSNDEFTLMLDERKGSSVKKLFMDKRSLTTLMFWIAMFMNLIALYGLSTWIPAIMLNAGYSLVSSLSFLLMLKAGAIVGAISGGRLSDRFGGKKVILLSFTLAFVTLITLGLQPNPIFSYMLLFIAGATISGTQMVSNSYISQYYPTEIRSTGAGWALGVGRIGGILGPILGGVVLSNTVPYAINFIVFAVPCLISALAFCFVRHKYNEKVTPAKIDQVEATVNVQN